MLTRSRYGIRKAGTTSSSSSRREGNSKAEAMLARAISGNGGLDQNSNSRRLLETITGDANTPAANSTTNVVPPTQPNSSSTTTSQAVPPAPTNSGNQNGGSNTVPPSSSVAGSSSLSAQGAPTGLSPAAPQAPASGGDESGQCTADKSLHGSEKNHFLPLFGLIIFVITLVRTAGFLECIALSAVLALILARFMKATAAFSKETDRKTILLQQKLDEADRENVVLRQSFHVSEQLSTKILGIPFSKMPQVELRASKHAPTPQIDYPGPDLTHFIEHINKFSDIQTRTAQENDHYYEKKIASLLNDLQQSKQENVQLHAYYEDKVDTLSAKLQHTVKEGKQLRINLDFKQKESTKRCRSILKRNKRHVAAIRAKKVALTNELERTCTENTALRDNVEDMTNVLGEFLVLMKDDVPTLEPYQQLLDLLPVAIKGHKGLLRSKSFDNDASVSPVAPSTSALTADPDTKSSSPPNSNWTTSPSMPNSPSSAITPPGSPYGSSRSRSPYGRSTRSSLRRRCRSASQDVGSYTLLGPFTSHSRSPFQLPSLVRSAQRIISLANRRFNPALGAICTWRGGMLLD